MNKSKKGKKSVRVCYFRQVVRDHSAEVTSEQNHLNDLRTGTTKVSGNERANRGLQA